MHYVFFVSRKRKTTSKRPPILLSCHHGTPMGQQHVEDLRRIACRDIMVPRYTGNRNGATSFPIISVIFSGVLALLCSTIPERQILPVGW